MKLDFKSLAFGYTLEHGTSTPAWETALGQGVGYKMKDLGTINELTKGMIYKAVSPKTISFKKGKGGAVVKGDAENASLVIAAVFENVFINDHQIENGKFILLIVKDDTESHKGRLKLKYGLDNAYTNDEGVTVKNRDFQEVAAQQLGLSSDACWFIYDISVDNQDTLRLKTIIVNDEGPMTYADNTALHAAWDALVEADSQMSKEGEEQTKTEFYETGCETKGFSRNRILFGAPGTGKSFTLNREAISLMADGGYVERVTFHPDYSYANFVGTYKPVMVGGSSDTISSMSKDVVSVLSDKTKTAQEKYDLLYDKFKDDGLTRLPILLGLYTDETFKTRKQDGTDAVGDNSVERNHGKALRPYVSLPSDIKTKEEIAYEYVPGPFMRVLAKALKSDMSDNPKPHLLIIEEINRANVAAVFGDVFQLLDRASNNVSEYEIATTNEMRTYLAKKLKVDRSAVKTIRIPDNMFLWATMNSADQGVYPMDTAFKRRWDFTYLGIDDREMDLIGKTVILGTGSTKQKVEWNKLRKAINNFLAKEKINEDKQLGPYFIARNIAVPEEGTEIDNDRFIHTFKSKVIMYLFEDAAKQKRPKLFEGCFENSSRYSEICREFDKKGIGIFHHDIQIEADPEDLAGATPVDNE